MARFAYGGQALIEGVLMRGRDAIAVALRHPDGRIVWADEKLAVGFRAMRWARLPFIRGLVVLYETLVVGTRWLVRSAGVAAAEAAGPMEASPGVAAESEPVAAVGATAAGPVAEPAAVSAAVGFTSAAADRTAAAPAAVERAAAEPAGATAGVTPPPASQAPPTAAVDATDLGPGAVALMLGVTLVIGIGLFFFLPLLLASAIAGGQSSLVQRIVEGTIQVAIFLGYLLLVGRTPDVRRTFEYHGAEHKTIHALEAGDPLTVEAVRKYPTAHPRCGTEFLVVVILVSIVVFSIVGRQAIPVMVATRIVLIPVIAGISYELLRFGARHRERRLVRWIFEPGIWVQMITTKQPTDEMLEVAIVSIEQALLADGEMLPNGSGTIGRSPLVLAPAAGPATGA
jgi:uncharacterized protein YqhQ